MLPDGAAVAAVCEGEDGVFAGAAPGTLVIDMSTIAPAEARRLAAAGAERGLAVLDAPVSGGDVGARAGTLSIMVGGERRRLRAGAAAARGRSGSTVTRSAEPAPARWSRPATRSSSR